MSGVKIRRGGEEGPASEAQIGGQENPEGIKPRILPTGDARQLAHAIHKARHPASERETSVGSGAEIDILEQAIRNAAEGAPVLDPDVIVQEVAGTEIGGKVFTSPELPGELFSTSHVKNLQGRQGGLRARPGAGKGKDDGRQQQLHAVSCELKVTVIPTAWTNQVGVV